MLLALLAANPAHIEQRRRWLRRVAIGLIFSLGAAALWSTTVLVDRPRCSGSQVTQSASSLLASGALIWLGNALVFSLIYWIFDTGGPSERNHRRRPYPDFAFSQHMSPELAPPDWRPLYVDYMILGLNTSAAFSPTDVMPMARWAKLAMSAQSLLSLTVIALVVGAGRERVHVAAGRLGSRSGGGQRGHQPFRACLVLDASSSASSCWRMSIASLIALIRSSSPGSAPVFSRHGPGPQSDDDQADRDDESEYLHDRQHCRTI